MFSYIITYRAGTQIRERNLHALVRHIRAGFADAQIVVVEQDALPRLNRAVLRDEKARYVFAYNPEEFNRGWGFNVGLAHAKYDVLVMGNHDFAIPDEMMLDALKAIKTVGVISPFEEVVDMRREDTTFFWDHRRLTISEELGHHRAALSEGIVLMTRESFLAVGGWDEKVVGRGTEDSLMSFKTEMMFPFDFLPGIGYHLFDEDATLAQAPLRTEMEYIETVKQKPLCTLPDFFRTMANGNGNPFKFKRKAR